jgi:ABC-2 type transport system permease protein
VVGTFVRLKVRLLRNRLRRSGALAIIAFFGFWLGALALGLLAGLASYLTTGLVEGALGIGWTFLALGWIVFPLLASALDETVEPTRLQLLPIPNVRLALGLLAAGAVGPGALATTLAVIGGVAGFAAPTLNLFGQVLAGVVMVVWCLVSARWLTTLLSNLLRSRRGRDLVAVIGPLIGLLAFAFSQSIQSMSIEGAQSGTRLLRFLWIFPPGALARSVEEFANNAGLALIFLGYGMAGTFVLVLLWGRSLARLVTKAPPSGPRSKARAGALVGGLLQRLANLGWATPVAAAVAAKEVRGLRRDPRLRAQFIGLGFALLVVATGVGRQLLGTEFAPLVAVAGAFIGVNATGFNLLGMDNGSFWAYVAAGVPWRSVMIGKNLAILIVSGTVTLALSTAGFILGGNLTTFLVALIASAAISLIWLAVGNNVSVLGAFAMPESNLFGSRTLPGGAFLPSIVGLMTAGALTIPVAGLIALPWLWRGPLAALVGALVAAGFALLIYRFSLQLAAGQIEERTPRLLEILDGR